MKKEVEPDPTLCFDSFIKILKNKEKIMAQTKVKKKMKERNCKLFRSLKPGDFVKVLENGIQSLIKVELSARLGAEPYQPSEQLTTYRYGYRKRKVSLGTGLAP